MLRIALCDDEEVFLKYEQRIIEEYLENLGYKYAIELFTDGEELMALEREIVKFDIIFLDIKMKKVDGMEIAYKLQKYSQKPFLVFVTAFVSYALEGYKVNAVRYLIKNYQNFESAVSECLDAILREKNVSKAVFEFKEGYRKINLKELIYIESSLHKLLFYMINGEIFTMYDKLDHISQQLEDYSFIRIHKSFLVNLRYIVGIKRYQAELQSGIRLNISKANYQAAKEKYINYYI